MEEETAEINTVDQKRCFITKRLDIFIVIGIFIVASPVLSYAAITKRDEICQTDECSETSSRILRDMNPEINPCDDFYEFACGNYSTSVPIKRGEFYRSRTTELGYHVTNQLKAVIEEPITPNEPRAFKLAKNFYWTCMNTSRIESSDLKTIRRILEQLGGWPVLNNSKWNQNNFSWIGSTYRSWKRGHPTDYLFNITVATDPRNNSKYTLELSPPTFYLAGEYLLRGLKSKEVDTYRDFMIDIAVLLGADRQRAEKELEESLKFEIKLADISPSEKDTLYPNSMTVAELSKKYPIIVNWVKYINKFLEPTAHVDATETVHVPTPSFFSKLTKLISKTPKKVLANYIGWRVVAQSIPYLTESLRNRTSRYNDELAGFNPGMTSIPRWEECLGILNENILSLSVSALYLREYFPQNIRQSVEEMVPEIRSELIKILRKSDWMDDKTRGKAIEKATAIFIQVAHPVELLDDEKLDDFFAPLTVSSDDFLEIYQNLSRFKLKTDINMLRKPVNKTAWLTHALVTEATAWYKLTENSIEISASYLGGSYFKIDRPRYMNYGGIGPTIGHELSHGFDVDGIQFDKDGNLVDWWTPESDQKYRDKADCFVDQYSNYTVPDNGSNVDGNITLSENIADNGGIKLAYRAYKEWVKRHGPEPKLPGLDYEPEQLFWISAASTECERYQPEYFDQVYDPKEPHSPGRFRVIGPFSNMPEFAADFNCPLGSKMNPELKCSIL